LGQTIKLRIDRAWGGGNRLFTMNLGATLDSTTPPPRHLKLSAAFRITWNTALSLDNVFHKSTNEHVRFIFWKEKWLQKYTFGLLFAKTKLGIRSSDILILQRILFCKENNNFTTSKLRKFKIFESKSFIFALLTY